MGPPRHESAEFASRARRVRDIGVRTAMMQWVFITVLTLVSALVLALVYGSAATTHCTSASPGDVVALLLTRLYAPLTALTSARVEVMSALVSFERVFQVLELRPLLEERSEACPRRTGERRIRPRELRLPRGGQGVPGVTRGRRQA